MAKKQRTTRTITKLACCAAMLALVAVAALPAFAESPLQPPARKGYAGWYCPPPRFQIFEARRPYGGLVMVDTQTGQSWQRVIVNSKEGIRVRWMPIPNQAPQPGETIIWD